MDPNAMLDELLDLLCNPRHHRDHEWRDRINECTDALVAWGFSGGFRPEDPRETILPRTEYIP